MGEKSIKGGEIGRSKRAGVPLARAERLAAQTSSTSGGKGKLALLAGVLGLAVVGVAVFSLSPESTAPTSQTVADSRQAAVTPAAPVTDINPTVAVDPDPAPPASTAPSPAQAAPTVAPVEQRVTQAACITAIEANLLALRDKSLLATSAPWPGKQDEINTLVQYVLDCSDGSIEMIGSMELVGSGLANLLVSWDRFAFTLQLRTVPKPAMMGEDPDEMANTYTETSDRRISFLIR